jgi:putative ABC transport system substrate-binding protein
MYMSNTLIKVFKTASCSLLFLFSPLLSFAQTPPVKISIIQLIEHPALNATREGLLDELKALGYEEGKNLILDFQSAQGSPILAAQIAQKFASNKPDVIVAIPTTAAQAVMSATKEMGIPLVFSSVTDPVSAKLVNNLQAPEGNVTGVSNFVPIEQQFSFFKKSLPSLKKLGIIYNPGEANSAALVALMEKTAKEFGWELVLASAPKSSDVLSATQSLCGKVDAVFVNNDNTALSAFKSVVRAAKECGIPALVSDIDIVNQGAFAALGPNQRELGGQTARMVDAILKNPGAPLPPVEFPGKTEEFVDSLP